MSLPIIFLKATMKGILRTLVFIALMLLNICPLLKGCRISRIQGTNLRKNNGKS